MLDKLTDRDKAEIRIVVAEPDRFLRSNLRQALFFAGFKNVTDVGSNERLHRILAEAPPDLLLLDPGLPDGDGGALIREMRFNRLGHNPFLPVIMTVWPEDTARIGRLIESGTDHILLKPISPQVVFERMEALIERRKPFIVTSGYIGPDRRRDARSREAAAIPTFVVPNTLRLRAKGQTVDPAALQGEIDAALGRVNEEMVRRQAFHIAFLVERAGPLLELGNAAGDRVVTGIAASLDELTARLDATAFTHVAELCQTLHALLAHTGEGWTGKDLAVLKNAAQAIVLGLFHGSDIADLTRKIRIAVEAYERRQRAGAGQ